MHYPDSFWKIFHILFTSVYTIISNILKRLELRIDFMNKQLEKESLTSCRVNLTGSKKAAGQVYLTVQFTFF